MAVSIKQAISARENGMLGGRPRDTRALKAARKIRERALALGRSQSLANLRFWLHIRDDVTKPLALRMMAASEIEDRFGLPRQSSSINVNADLTQEQAKLFELVGDFTPPDTWHEHPPEASMAVVVEDAEEDS